jgi:hypothetical protein
VAEIPPIMETLGELQRLITRVDVLSDQIHTSIKGIDDTEMSGYIYLRNALLREGVEPALAHRHARDYQGRRYDLTMAMRSLGTAIDACQARIQAMTGEVEMTRERS